MTTPSPAWKVLAFLGFFALSALPTAHIATSSAAGARAERISRVESGLLPITATRSHLGQYANILDRMRAYGVPGVSIAVIADGRIDWAKGYGLADIATRTPVTSDTAFEAASLSKPLAALGAMILVERGKLGLDTDVNDYLRQWKVPNNRMTQVHPVTLRTLLDHSAGLTDVALPSYRPGEVAPTLAEALKTLAPGIRVETVPGRQYRYGATAFLVLQLLLQDVTKTPFPQYMQSQVFGPLHMSHSTFAEPLPGTLLESAAIGYYAGGVPVAGGYRFGPGSAASGLWATPSDLARYITELQRDYAGTDGGLLNPAMSRQMLSAQIAYRGLGVVLSGKGDDMRFGHDGFEYGFESAMVGYVHRGQGAVVMANSGFAYMLIKEIMGSIARAYRWPDYGWTNQWPPMAALRQQEVTKIPAGVLAAARGRYAFDKSVSIDIYTDGSRLFLRYPDNGDAEIFRTPGGDFFCPQLTFSDFGDPRLRFELAKGKVQEIIASYGHLRLRRMN
jgi:CubicO group peptidase (beta-lactamase class C family)